MKVIIPENGRILKLINDLDKKLQEQGIENKEELLGNIAQLNAEIENLYAILAEIEEVVFTDEDVNDVLNMVDGINDTL